MRIAQLTGVISGLSLLLSSCGGSDSSTSPAAGPITTPVATPAALYAVPAPEALTTADVSQILAQTIGEARARNLPAVVSVVDRVGNVLAVYRMTGARANATAAPAPNGLNIDAQNATIPAEGGAIAKAITGAYLSSGGNAFSTRTASAIVQQHFPPSPTTVGIESGPLFGVQFSSLPCSDLVRRFNAVASPDALIGPKRSPVGLSADPGGFPLYKNGVVVGGVGVMADGVYGFDANVLDVDNDDEEFIALAGTIGFDAPDAIRAERIPVDGSTLRYSDATAARLKGGTATAFASLPAGTGALVAVRGYYDYAPVNVIRAGTPYGSEASGIRASLTTEFSNRDAFILSDGSGANRYPIRAGTDGGAVAAPLTAAESRAVLEEAFTIMSRARAQIRRPLDSRAQVSISVVDTYGSVLGLVRSPDAPIFGVDVSLQKARTAAFFSNSQAASQLLGNPSPDVVSYVSAMRTFFNNPNILTGQTAWSNRAIGNIARPYFPDGELNRPPGPLSRPIAQFNPFSTGLQSALIIPNVGQHLTYLASTTSADTPARCTFTPDVILGQNRLQNGIQIFPGSFPIYRGATLVGAIGISGDGIDQDDMIAFLGASNAGIKVGGIGLPAAAMRSDQVTATLADGAVVRLRFGSCPFAPFLDTADQNVCQGR